MRPHLCDIENIPLIVGSLSLGHDLSLAGPGGSFSRSKMSEKVSCGIVRVVSFKSIGFSSAEGFISSISLEVKLNPEGLSLGVDPFEGVGAVAVHMSVAIGGSSIGEKNGNLMNRLGNQTEEVPEHIGAFKVGLRVSLLSVDEVGEFDGISDEEDRGVVTSHIPVTLLSVEFAGESSGISLSIGGALLSSHS